MNPKSIKNVKKSEATMGVAHGIDFSWIFLDFGRQVGAELVSKIDQKAIRQGHQKKMGNKKKFWDRFRGVQGRSWTILVVM